MVENTLCLEKCNHCYWHGEREQKQKREKKNIGANIHVYISDRPNILYLHTDDVYFDGILSEFTMKITFNCNSIFKMKMQRMNY